MVRRSVITKVGVLLFLVAGWQTTLRAQSTNAPVSNAVVGVTAPFGVDTTALFTNNVNAMSYVELTNLLKRTDADIKDTGAQLPTKLEAKRQACRKSFLENPAVIEVRHQVDALNKKADDLVKADPSVVAVDNSIKEAQKSLLILAEKRQILNKRIYELEQAAPVSGGVTNQP